LEIDQFNPAIAFRLIGENAREIERIGNEIILARSAMIMAEANYMDAKSAAKIRRMAEMNVTQAKEWVDIDTTKERKEYIMAEARMKNFMEQKDIVVEAHNALKTQIRLWEIEFKNLTYTQ
jgi:hypothetical protein